MQQENNTDNLDKYRKHSVHLTSCCHIEENAEDVYGQKRDNHRADGHRDNLLKLLGRAAQSIAFDIGESQTDNKS